MILTSNLCCSGMPYGPYFPLIRVKSDFIIIHYAKVLASVTDNESTKEQQLLGANPLAKNHEHSPASYKTRHKDVRMQKLTSYSQPYSGIVELRLYSGSKCCT